MKISVSAHLHLINTISLYNMALYLLLREAWIHHIDNSIDRKRCLRNISAHNNFTSYQTKGGEKKWD